LEWPSVDVDLLPACFELGEFLAVIVDLSAGPIARSPGRSIRFTSSPVNGAYFARQLQNHPPIFERLGL